MILNVFSFFFFLQYLGDTNHHVRSKCLDLIGALGSPDQRKPEDSQSESRKTLQKFLADFTHDQDCRVRTSAFQAMVGLFINTHS